MSNMLYKLLPLFIIITIYFLILVFFILPWYNYSKNFRALFIREFGVFDIMKPKLLNKSSIVLVLPVRKNCYVYGGYALIVDVLIYSRDEILFKYNGKKLNLDINDVAVYKVSSRDKLHMRIFRYLLPVGNFRSLCIECLYIMIFKYSNKQNFYFAIDENLYDLISNLKGQREVF